MCAGKAEETLMMHITDNQEALLDYLYEEGDPADRVKAAQHLQECAPCSVAVLELQSVRGLLTEWAPPEAALDFSVKRAVPVTLARGWRLGAGWPAWAQAAAALVLFAAGMGVSQLHVEYGGGTLTVRTRAAEAAPAAEASVTHSGTDVLLPPTFVNISDDSAGRPAPPRPASAEEVLQSVKALIDQSESRQQRELALRLQDVVHDFDTQRQADMQRVDQNLGQLEGQTAQEVARNRELFNSLVKVSQGGVR
jgi:hypothetical protein